MTRKSAGKTWANCQFATIDVVRDVRERKQMAHLVWPEEGEFLPSGNFKFNEEHSDYEPLMLDMQTANVLMTCYAALTKPDTVAKVVDWIAKSRGHFAKIVEIGWGAVR